MKIKIFYCAMWGGYKDEAFRLKEEILSHFKDADIEILVGKNGELRITLDDKEIYKSARFLEKGEIISLLS